MIKKQTIKKFLKPSIFKFILVCVIAILPIMGVILYNDDLTVSDGTLKSEANLGIKTLYHGSKILFLPFEPVKLLFIKFEQKHLEPSFYFEKQKFLILISLPHILAYLAYSYLLGCSIIHLVCKTQKTIKNKKD